MMESIIPDYINTGSAELKKAANKYLEQYTIDKDTIRSYHLPTNPDHSHPEFICLLDASAAIISHLQVKQVEDIFDDFISMKVEMQYQVPTSSHI
jgi:hypothetical protein